MLRLHQPTPRVLCIFHSTRNFCKVSCIVARACSDTIAAQPALDTEPSRLQHEKEDTLHEPKPITFEELGVDERLSVMLPKYGIKYASEIQVQAIPRLLRGETLAIQSFTGSGKTLAFLLPALTVAVQRLQQRVKSNDIGEGGPEAIIIAPSRELAMQIVRVAQQLLPQEAWPLVQQTIGGANLRRQVESMRSNKPLLVIGTPGRMAEHSRMGTLRTHRTPIVILDEVDQLLCPQFKDDLLRIVQHAGSKVPSGAQYVAASATLSPLLLSQMASLLRLKNTISLVNPEMDWGSQIRDQQHRESLTGKSDGISDPEWGWGQDSGFWEGRAGAASTRGSAGGVLPQGATRFSIAPHLRHCYLVEVKRHHVDTLRRLVYALDAKHVMVFMNHQNRLKDAVHKLQAKGMSAGALHGELGKQQRQSVLARFGSGELQVLLVSDVVARGLDVQSCDAVVNLEMPSNEAHYAHRAGRAGRMGRPGIVCSIVEKQHEFVVQKFSKSLDVDISQCKATGGRATIIQDGKVEILGRFYDSEAIDPDQ